MPSRFHSILFVSVFGLFLASLAQPAQAQGVGGGGDTSGSSSDALRAAGGEAHFRVIQRFSEDDEATAEPALGSAFAPALQAVQRQEWSRANGLLAKPATAKALTKPAEIFLAGYVAHRSNQHQRAYDLLHPLSQKFDVLADYVDYYAALSAHEAGRHHEAALLAARVGEESVLYAESLSLLADALIASDTPDDLSRASELMGLYLRLYGNRRNAASVRLKLAQTLEKREQWEDAAERYLEFWEQHPLSTSADQAQNRLQALKPRLSDAMKKRIDSPTQAKQIERTMRRYRALFESHRSETVIADLSKVVDRWPKGGAERCEALFLIGRSHTKLRQHAQGTTWYERVIAECKGQDFELRSLYLGGRGLWNAGERAKARAMFKRIWTEWPRHSFADDAMYFSARILRDEGKPKEAEALLREQVKRYPTDDMAKDAHWLLVRQMFETKAYPAVVAYVDALSELGEDDLYSRGRLHYFRARALELSGDTNAASKAFTEVIATYPKTYYALLAFNRLADGKRVDGKPAANLCQLDLGAACAPFAAPVTQPAPIAIPDSLRQEPAFQKGLLLLELGLTDLARTEFSRLRTRHAKAPETLWALAHLLDRAHAHPLSHDIPRRALDGWVKGYPDAATFRQWEVAFPTPFAVDVRKYATQRKVPVAMIYAIMREESGFNPQVESWANARGLLQLMEATAQSVAKSDGMGTVTAAQLFEPQINIRLGSAYMAELGGQLNNHSALIIAGYNGGHANVARWLRERGELPLDLFVEDIPFGQTRNYTKRVLASFWAYAALYDEDKVPYLAFSLR